MWKRYKTVKFVFKPLKKAKTAASNVVGIVVQPYVAIEWDVCMYVRACVA